MGFLRRNKEKNPGPRDMSQMKNYSSAAPVEEEYVKELHEMTQEEIEAALALEQKKAEHRDRVSEIRKTNAIIAEKGVLSPEEQAAFEAREREYERNKAIEVREANAAETAAAAEKNTDKEAESKLSRAERAGLDKSSNGFLTNPDFNVELPSKMKKKKRKLGLSPFIEGIDDSAWTVQLKPGEEYAIKAENVKIRYKSVASYSIKRSFLLGEKADTSYFEAVRGVSFEVKKGEIFGITGQNGSGKSTLLRALGHIFSADEGKIDLFNHSVSLLAIGVGFMPDLTGRENIMLSGMLLGFSEKEVKSHMDDIMDFAGLGDFIDMPVRTYSSGMHSKLAFSITAFLDTDIMLIDEVFSVGDANFKKKSYAKMQELISNKNRTVVIVSHNLFTLETLCDRVMWMHEGRIVKIGDPLDIIEEYREFMS